MGTIGTIAGTITGGEGYEPVASGNPILTPDDNILPSGEKKRDQEEVDEGMKEYLTVALIANMLAIPGVIKASDIEKSIPNKATASDIQMAVNSIPSGVYGGYSLIQAVNIITRTLYSEARGESLEGKQMVATVIWNRSGGNPDKFVSVCFKNSQFSAWNKADRSTLAPGKYQVKVSGSATANPIAKKAWDECKEIATSMFGGSFSPLGTWNAYLNPKTADQSALDTWGTTMTNQKVVGRHRFGYLTDQDPTAKKIAGGKKQNTYTVSSGDSISKIASKLISSGESDYTSTKDLVAKIVQLNKLKNNGNLIRVGQVLVLPESARLA